MKAGNDLIMPGGGSYKKEILAGVKSGMISEKDVRRCCANVVRAIFNSATQKEYIDQRKQLKFLCKKNTIKERRNFRQT